MCDSHGKEYENRGCTPDGVQSKEDQKYILRFCVLVTEVKEEMPKQTGVTITEFDSGSSLRISLYFEQRKPKV